LKKSKKTKSELSRIAHRAVLTRKVRQRKKIRVRAAKKASRKNILSELNFVERLRKKGFLAFSTGKAEGPPDIVAYKNRKLSFYEIKPSQPSNPRNGLLKRTQSDWIKKYCFNKKIEVNLAFYKGSRPFKYSVVKITKKNISDFETNQKNLDDIIERAKSFSYK